MTTANYLTQLQQDREDLVDNLEAKGITGLSGDETFTELVPEVLNIPSGGGGSTGDYLLKVIDYDGTVLKEEYHNNGDIVTLPNAPSHTGLTFQTWSSNQTITNNSVTFGNGDIIIGAVYTTSSGLNEFDIELNAVTGLSVTLNMDGTKNWGDGTSDTTTSHTYSSYGKYTISCDGTSASSNLFTETNVLVNAKLVNFTTDVTLSNSIALKTIIMSNSITKGVNCYGCSLLKAFVMPPSKTTAETNMVANCFSLKNLVVPNTVTKFQTPSATNYSLKEIALPNSIINNFNALLGYGALRRITLPNNITKLNTSIFADTYDLEKVVIPSSVTTIEQNAFQNCRLLETIDLPNGITTLNKSVFNGCYNLKSIIIPSSLTSINNYAFQYCYNIMLYDFRNVSVVPTLSNTNAFISINPHCKIVVPDSLYSSWITANNWSTYANYIVKASDYTE